MDDLVSSGSYKKYMDNDQNMKQLSNEREYRCLMSERKIKEVYSNV
ncbi:MAG: hypothetical protein ACI4EG_10375 [Fusicatenibacter sp.]|nr:hypothetical protein [Fusicatenibacter sp.]